MGIVAVTCLALAAEASEHKRAEERVRQLAATDPLTELANYRRLLDTLDLEIKRYGRHGTILCNLAFRFGRTQEDQ
jgi:GGDEF domain-containing protein